MTTQAAVMVVFRWAIFFLGGITRRTFFMMMITMIRLVH